MVAKKMGPSQAPICEAFIMTGETILKTYTNKSENGTTNKTLVRQADTTTPDLQDSATNSIHPTTASANGHVTTTKTECTHNRKVNNNKDENENEKDYIKHAQYRVALALEQRGKSFSLSKLSELGYSNEAGPFKAAAFLTRRGPIAEQSAVTTSGIGDTSRKSFREEASARVQVPVLLHEQQHSQQQQQELDARLQRQQKLLHEHVNRQNSEEQTTQGPLEGLDRNVETKQPKDCEYKRGAKQEIVLSKHGNNRIPIAQKRKLQMTDQRPAPVTRTATFIVTPRSQMKQDLSKLNGGQRFDDDDFSIQFKTGFLSRKRTFAPGGKPTSKGQRGWRRVYVILRDLRFIVRYGQQAKTESREGDEADTDEDGQSAAPDSVAQKMEAQSAKTRKQLAAKDLKNTIRLHHSFAKRSATYTKREYVFHLYLADQSELLLQASSESEMNSWIDTINFASACLSSPPLPKAVSNNKRYQQSCRSRPMLPASYTKLSYWEQLTDHEERLERLKAELEEHLNEAPVKRYANKRSKSEFIDNIAYLRQKIEHYTVYLDLMQKKSNSPEAIVLSKHPQIASLTPSKEMVRSLPLKAKAHEDEDKKDTS